MQAGSLLGRVSPLSRTEFRVVYQSGWQIQRALLWLNLNRRMYVRYEAHSVFS